MPSAVLTESPLPPGSIDATVRAWLQATTRVVEPATHVATPGSTPGAVRTPDPDTSQPLARHPAELDAETLASMVNEVLAEQALRHGVDLS
jgi:hypothetical protein